MAEDEGGHRWGLLLPVCYRGKEDASEVWERLQAFADSLAATTTSQERALLFVQLGYDQFDLVFDHEPARQRIRDIFEAMGVAVAFTMLRSHYRGKLCKIWDRLAQEAVEQGGAEFFVLMGDDLELLTQGWKAEVERRFAAIAQEQGLPFGCACVAFRDLAFPVFPTFPVMHRLHLGVFRGLYPGGGLFPQQLVNQHGDPFLFELYRRWGASEFAPTAALINKVGGKGTARYTKQGADWRDGLLTQAIDTLAAWLPPEAESSRLHCLNVVVPSYRCDVAALSSMAQLRVSPQAKASLHTLVVVDNPSSPHIGALQGLQDWSPNHLVRVYVQAENQGASLTRNSGMAQSFGDWTVLLDDDVEPQPDILDAYLGAIQRHPGARIFVGLTKLPPPTSLLQQALVTSQVSFFFSIAERLPHPPWGVTANMCVPGRSNNCVWFSSAYPKTGGGEDYEFCLKLKTQGTRASCNSCHSASGASQGYLSEKDEVIVAVPEAVVVHPFWARPLRQIAGWAAGDVLCVEALPHSTFRALPNWAELLLLLGVGLAFTHGLLPWLPPPGARPPAAGSAAGAGEAASAGAGAGLSSGPTSPAAAPLLSLGQAATAAASAAVSALLHWAAAAAPAVALFAWCAAGVLAVELVLGGATTYPRTPRDLPHHRRLAIAALALLPALIQDGVRLRSKLARCRPTQLCLHVDWMDGQGEHRAALQFALLVKALAWALLLGCIVLPHAGGTALLPAWATWAAAVVLGLLVLFWAHSQYSDQRAAFKHSFLRSLPPLPLSLPQETSSSSPLGPLSTKPELPGSQPAGPQPSSSKPSGHPSHPQPFVVLAYQRTGSNLLCGLLHHHPQLLMHNEAFNEAKIFSYNEDLLQAPAWTWDIFSRDRDPQAFLTDLLSTRHPRKPTRAVGLKLFPEHWRGAATTAVFQRLVADPRVKKVVLKREDVLAVYASKLRADKTGAYIGKPLDGVPLAVDPASLQGFAVHYEEVYEYYASLLKGQGPESVFWVTYEELVGGGSHAAAAGSTAAARGPDGSCAGDGVSCRADVQPGGQGTGGSTAGASSSSTTSSANISDDKAAATGHGAQAAASPDGLDGGEASASPGTAPKALGVVHDARENRSAGRQQGEGQVDAEVVRRLLHFLGVDPHIPLKPLAVTVRQSREPLCKSINNYEDLAFAFKCTKLAACFQGAPQ